jgi:hypothetical protein
VGKKPKSPKRLDVRSETLKNQGKKVPAIFYRTEAGGEPLREWLKQLSSEDRKHLGTPGFTTRYKLGARYVAKKSSKIVPLGAPLIFVASFQP